MSESVRKRFKLRFGLGSLLASGAVVALVLGNPLSASATWASYYSGNTSNATWRSSYDRSQENQGVSCGLCVVQVKTAGVTSTGTGGVTQTYTLQTVWEYCRVQLPTSSIGIMCQVYVN